MAMELIQPNLDLLAHLDSLKMGHGGNDTGQIEAKRVNVGYSGTGWFRILIAGRAPIPVLICLNSKVILVFTLEYMMRYEVHPTFKSLKVP